MMSPALRCRSPAPRRNSRKNGLVSRYQALTEHLKQREHETVVCSFAELDRIVGGLPESARRHAAWWSNSRTSQPHSRYWLDAGRRARPDFNGSLVVFELGAETVPASGGAVSARHPGVRTTLVCRQSVDLERTSEANAGEVTCAWFRAGNVLLNDGKPHYPALPAVGGIYRFRLTSAVGAVTTYVGESEHLARRMASYRMPGPTQTTNQRMHRRIIDTLCAGGSVEVAVVLNATLAGEQLALGDKAARRLVENFVLVQEARSGHEIENL